MNNDSSPTFAAGGWGRPSSVWEQSNSGSRPLTWQQMECEREGGKGVPGGAGGRKNGGKAIEYKKTSVCGNKERGSHIL